MNNVSNCGQLRSLATTPPKNQSVDGTVRHDGRRTVLYPGTENTVPYGMVWSISNVGRIVEISSSTSRSRLLRTAENHGFQKRVEYRDTDTSVVTAAHR
jgi:hypothetical protein